MIKYDKKVLNHFLVLIKKKIQFFFLYIKKSKDLHARYYQKKQKQIKSKNMVTNVITERFLHKV